MTTQELYYTFSLLLNKNSESRNIYVEKEDFVILYNRESERFLSDYIERNNNSDNIFNLEHFIVRDHSLKQKSSDKTKTVYELPENLFQLIHGDFYSLVDSGECSKKIFNYLYKPEDINTILDDKFTRPSLTWERGAAKVGKHELVVFKDNFDIAKTFISYYKKPLKIDIEGYVNFDNVNSIDSNPDYEDYIANLIVDRVVLEVHREFENAGGYQLSGTRERIF